MASRAQRWKELSIQAALFVCAAVSILTTAGIVVVLAVESWQFFTHEDASVGLFSFLFGTTWTPMFEPRSFGVLPLILGTLQVGVGAVAIALPIGLATSLFLSEYAPHSVRQVLKPILEILAGVPTIVYGFFALTFITPYVLKPLFGEDNVGVFNVASATLVVAIMIIPTISSLCDDAFRAVPRTLREAAFALSATRLEVSTRAVLPAALSGVVGSVVLALARAIGETMAVAIAAGATPSMSCNPFESTQTMTAYIVQVVMGEAAVGSVEYQSLFAVGAVLFVITLAINVVAQRVLARFREAYE